jgi:hypothetical protein
MCNYLAGPGQDALSILWSDNEHAGAFKLASPAGRVALSEEQYRLVWQVMLHEPLWTLQTAAQNLAEQTFRFRVDEFAPTDGLREKLAQLPAEEAERARQTMIYRDDFPLALFGDLIEIGAVLALAAVATALLFRHRAPSLPRDGPSSASLAAFFVMGLLVNAAVTGILSGPFDRYQARVIWLLPLLAIILIERQMTAVRRRANSRALF